MDIGPLLSRLGVPSAACRRRRPDRPHPHRRQRDRQARPLLGRGCRSRGGGGGCRLPAVARGAGAAPGRADPAVRRELRAHQEPLAELVSIECGKILAEALGEVQEMIDICDFAVGLSRQLYGLTMASERPGHRLMETWHPLGPVGVITAFNFPVAVWAWNFAVAIVCGDPVVWKPSEKTPLSALACAALFRRAAERFGEKLPGRPAAASSSAAPRPARRWPTIRGCGWSAPPGAAPWAGRWRRWWRAASAGCCSSSAATTP